MGVGEEVEREVRGEGEEEVDTAEDSGEDWVAEGEGLDGQQCEGQAAAPGSKHDGDDKLPEEAFDEDVGAVDEAGRPFRVEDLEDEELAGEGLPAERPFRLGGIGEGLGFGDSVGFHAAEESEGEEDGEGEVDGEGMDD